ncbi:MAG: ROK family protein [Kiritimatiellae bacterium]|nr:ROK family protein [Kiritimatiellia bacterium]
MTFGQGKATLRMAGEHNRKLVFQILRRFRRASRQQISEITGLHRSTLSKIMAEFLSSGLAREVGPVQPPRRRVGKRQIHVELCGEAGWTLGFGLSPGFAQMAVVDVAGGLVGSTQFEIERDLAKVPATLKVRADEWFSSHPTPAGRFFGVGVAVTGITDPDSGVVIYSEGFRVRNHPLAAAVREVFGARTTIDNDARAEAIAHLNQPTVPTGSDLLFLYLRHREVGDRVEFTDVGAAIVLGGRVFRGSHRGAGEIWGDLRPALPPPVTMAELRMIETPDAAINDHVEAVVEALAPIAATLAGFMDPDTVVLGGTVDWRNRTVLNVLEARLNERIRPWYAERRIRVECAEVPAAGAAYGAALLAMDEVPGDELFGTPAAREMAVQARRRHRRRRNRRRRAITPPTEPPAVGALVPGQTATTEPA